MSGGLADGDPKPALDYATPVQVKSFSIGKLFVGLAASVLVAVGVGLLFFGWMMAQGVRENFASLIGGGLTCLTLGVGILGSYFFARMR